MITSNARWVWSLWTACSLQCSPRKVRRSWISNYGS